MEALRKIEVVNSDSIVIDNLERFRGRKVEILIFPCDYETDSIVNNDVTHLFGSLKSDIDGLEFQKAARAEW